MYCGRQIGAAFAAAVCAAGIYAQTTAEVIGRVVDATNAPVSALDQNA